MAELRQDMLPDESQTQPVVSEDVQPPEQPSEPAPASAVEPEEPAETAAPQPTPPKGYVPYADLKKERERRKELQTQLDSLQSSGAPEEEETVEPTDDVATIRQEIRELKLDKLVQQFPELNDKRAELDDYLEENSSLSLERAVNLFRLEAGLIGGSPERPGLETPTGGPKTAPTSGYTPEQVEEMRKNNYRLYQKLLAEGKFDHVRWR